MASEKVNEHRVMMEDRHPDMMRADSPHDIMRAGGSDPRRYDAKIVMDRKIKDHDMSGYNHNGSSSQPANGGHENEMWAKERDIKAVAMGTPEVDGTYRR